MSSRPRDNRERLVSTIVTGRVAPARLLLDPISCDEQGRLVLLPGCGGIAAGVRVGDPLDRWLGDHLMPGISAEAEDDPAVPGAFHELACLGNPARDAAGRALGVVCGKRGGLAPGHLAPSLVAIDPGPGGIDHLLPGDRVVLRAQGRGLALTGFPAIGLSNLSPAALDALPLRQDSGRLVCSVRTVVPAHVAGPGLGQSPWIGDLEITADEAVTGSPAGLRFGDLVAFRDIDGRVNRFYRPGFVSVGVMAHGSSPVAGHGPGATIIMAGPASLLATPANDALPPLALG